MRDVIVVGGGPAGSASAIRLARLGYDVLLLDQAHFPRPKPCAEYLSPGTVQELVNLGAWPPTEHLPGLRGFIMYPDGARAFTCDFNALPGTCCTWGTAVPRRILDTFLLDMARQEGVEVRQEMRVNDLLYGDRRLVVGVMGTYGGKTHTLRSRLVVGADGLRSVVGRRLGLLRRNGSKRVALVAHYAGIADLVDFGEMHLMPGGYCGIAPLGGGLANVAMVLFEDRTAAIQGQVEATFEAVLRDLPGLQGRLERAELASPVLTTGPFGQSTRRAAAEGAMLVGDAADFFDPFTGQGIYSALRGAGLVAQVAHSALQQDLPGDLKDYDRLRRREFTGKWLVERLIQHVVARRGLMNRVAHNLARHADLSAQLVRVTGDVAPARQVLQIPYLLRILR